MPNLLLTQKCVRSCPYCFAKKHMSDSPPDDIITWENLIYIADLLEISNEKNISLLGGEPFLHPFVIDIILYLTERNFHVNLFTSGIISNNRFSEAEKYITKIDPKKISFVCNINDPKISTFAELESVKKFLFVFGHLVTVGFNIYRYDFNLDFIFDYINRYGLRKHIRLGLAHPIPGEKNMYIKKENLDKMVEKLISYFPVFQRMKVEPGFDCGFPMCIFSDETIGQLFKVFRTKLNFGCGPAIDIGPDMTVWSCFPLSNYQKKSIYEFSSFQEIYDYYVELHKKTRNELGGIFPECNFCTYRENGVCYGGCLAHILNHFLDEPEIRIKEVYPDA